MKVIFHTGLHCTDDDRLLKGLLRNADDWRNEGIAIPGPSRYRALLSESVNALAHGRPAHGAREILLDGILSDDPENVKRLILSHPNFFSVPRLALSGGIPYRKAEMRLRALGQLFDGDEIELCIGLRDFASWIPALKTASGEIDYLDLLHGAEVPHLHWSSLIRRLRSDLPDMPITVWCNEDTPLIWGMILRRMAGIAPGRKIVGAFDMMSRITAPEAMKRFRAFLRENPDITEPQKRRVMAAFLDKYMIEDAVEEELDLPGWTDDFVDALSAAYDQDIDQIAGIEGVTVLMP